MNVRDEFERLAENAAAMNAEDASRSNWSDDPQFTSKQHYDDVQAGRASLNPEHDALIKYAAESRDDFLTRTDGRNNYVEECTKRSYALASPEERALWMGNPFETEYFTSTDRSFRI